MGGRFVILNNSLRDHCGHYFETSIALAEAARRCGWHPVLATHVNCPASLLPDWLDSYPIFCTDHWMTDPPAEPPDLGDFRSDLYASPQVTIERVRGGEATVRDFVSGLFNCLPPADGRADAVTGRVPNSAVDGFCSSYSNMVWAIERLGFYLFPPVLDGLLRKAARCLFPRILVPGYHARIRQRIAEKLLSFQKSAPSSVIDEGPCGPETARALENEAEREWIRQALIHLRPQGFGQELDHALIFKRDLERLLTFARIGAGDHVLLGTAHAREVAAVSLVCRRLSKERLPTFHLEFRHPLFRSRATSEELAASPTVNLHRSFLALHNKWGEHESVKFYTDTAELSRDFERLDQGRFGVLPIPFRSELIEAPRREPDEPLRLVFLGQARDEKGFPWLPDLVDDLMADYIKSGKVRFLIQANVGVAQYNPLSGGALERLREHPPEIVELLGLEKPLSPDEYYRLVSQASIVLLPYDRGRYAAASSGTLADAFAGGRPVIVPDECWLANQLPRGSGEAFRDYESFVSSVCKVIDNYETYAARAQERSAAWVAEHAPDALVAAVTGASPIAFLRLHAA